MLVANSFDLWQKDSFFSAAEEVQQSADRMESAHRTWLRARREELIPQNLNEITRELQMALGTAKWQLEEFERAIHISYRNNSDDSTTTRHREFVTAIQDQILRVETALKESLNTEGTEPFRWVNLDEEECDDLEHFLSGTPGTSHGSSLRRSNAKGDSPHGSGVSSILQTANQEIRLKEVPRSIVAANSFIELQESKFPESADEIRNQVDEISNNRRAWSLSDRTALEIVVDNDERPRNALVESTPKEKGFKSFFWRPRSGAKSVPHLTRMKILSWVNRNTRGGHRSQRQHLMSSLFPVNSIRFVLAFMLTIFLVVPFLLYST
ncbi:uncharacterized protein LOC127264159 [Andrographis paniculata]|uniref:uncharacterized protein LOC127264159 n=1 Tax=Andrographis paniculata TaxID=175694 RepID=UPI0021E8D86B|nr:uncharacterized protein LOC127264159 [Andrographis paniculata]